MQPLDAILCNSTNDVKLKNIIKASGSSYQCSWKPRLISAPFLLGPSLHFSAKTSSSDSTKPIPRRSSSAAPEVLSGGAKPWGGGTAGAGRGLWRFPWLPGIGLRDTGRGARFALMGRRGALGGSGSTEPAGRVTTPHLESCVCTT